MEKRANGVVHHELAKRSLSVYEEARHHLMSTIAYVESTDTGDTGRMKLALSATAYACDAFKAAANAYGSLLSRLEHETRTEKR